MTELQFLIDLLLNHKIPKATKDAIAKRIGEVEINLSSSPSQIKQSVPAQRIINGAVQSASMAALIDKQESGAVPNETPIVLAPTAPIPANALAVNRIKGGMVNTGNGMKGPRKF